jgi:hypothetical protein
VAKRTLLGALWRWLAFLVLLPVVAAELWALLLSLGEEAQAARRSGPATEAVWLSCGAAAYALLHLFLHKPITTYVFGHEMTHALWALLTGHKVGRIRVGSDSGHVETEGTNFVVRLAPYFFPLYTLLFVGGWLLAELCWPELRAHRGWLFAGAGFTYAFHALLTVHSLRAGQSDLAAEGVCFSLALIAAVNLQIVVALLAAASKAVTWWGYEKQVAGTLWRWAEWAVGLLR